MATKQEAKLSEDRRIHRSRYEIVCDILTLCLRPTRKTKVMYRANLSFDQANLYLKNLESCGALEKQELDDESCRYVTSEEGRKWVENYQKLNIVFGDFGFREEEESAE